MPETVNANTPRTVKKTRGMNCEETEALRITTAFNASKVQASGVNLEIICIYFGAISMEKKEPPIKPVTVMIMADRIVKFCCFFVSSAKSSVRPVSKNRYAKRISPMPSRLLILPSLRKYLPAARTPII